MIDEKRVRYFRTALAISNIVVDDLTADLILRIVNKLDKVGGDFTVHDSVEIMCSVEYDHKQRHLQNVNEINSTSA